MSYKIISRSEASALGYKRYYTNKPCRRGHTSQRYTSTGGCCACVDGRNQDHRNLMQQLLRSANLGAFSMMIAEGDFAEAEAFCQALNLRRGLMPGQRVTPTAAVATMVTPPATLPPRSGLRPYNNLAASRAIQQMQDDQANAEIAERQAMIASRLASAGMLPDRASSPHIPQEAQGYLTKPTSNG